MSRRATTAARSAVVAVALLIATAAALLALGRTPWCTCGVVRLWTGDVNGPENSQQIADPYTFTHITHGIAFYALFAVVGRRRRWSLCSRALATIGLECAWEILENTPMVIERYRAATLAIGYYGDSVVNSLADVVACIAGFFLAARLPVWVSLLVVIALEATLTLTIRDSLLLNVLMLVYPVDAVKRWQGGG